MTDLGLSDIDIVGADEHPPDSSVKINGPPGTGKTTQSAARVGTLLDEYGYDARDVLWGTYRRSLAEETLERLANWGLIPETELSDPKKGKTRFIGTMHAVATRLANWRPDMVKFRHKREFATERGLRFDKRSAWDEPPGRLLFDVFDYAATNKLDLDNPRDRNRIPKLDTLQNEYSGDLARTFGHWQDFKAQRDIHDFWEQLAEPLGAGVTPSQPIVVVDEYHDAYPLMAELAESWIEAADIAIVAGDPLQVVNHYAGARPKFYKRLDLPEVQLPTAWERPPVEHWAPATQLLEQAHEVPEVHTDNHGSYQQGQSPHFAYDDDTWHVPGPDDPRSPPWIIDEYGTDTMFLSRTQKQAAGVAKSLERAGILYKTQSSMDVEGWGGARDMAERMALFNALQRLTGVSPPEGRGGLSRFDDDTGRKAANMVFRHAEAAAILDHANHKYLSESRSDITDAAEEFESKEVIVRGDELAEYVEPEFWDTYGRGAGSVRHLKRSANRQNATGLTDEDIAALKAAMKRNDEPVASVDTTVFTIHASKGSEAKNVVVYDGVTSRIKKSMQQSEAARKNEYRTWYVALTRSRANLIVLRDGFDWVRQFLPKSLLRVAQEAHESSGVNA